MVNVSQNLSSLTIFYINWLFRIDNRHLDGLYWSFNQKMINIDRNRSTLIKIRLKMWLSTRNRRWNRNGTKINDRIWNQNLIRWWQFDSETLIALAYKKGTFINDITQLGRMRVNDFETLCINAQVKKAF